MKKAQEILADMLESVPEVKLAILLDIDGIPLAKAGESSLHPDDLGAMLAAASRSYIVLGEDMGQGSFDQITVNYRDTKLLQFGMARSSLALVAAADASMSIIKLEAKRAVVQLEDLMDVTVDEREVMMQEYQLARPEEDEENRRAGLNQSKEPEQ
jgi:predicted regulator of Ras-like GTPase activity (Roadblock/LC7/MglB family)